MEMKAHLQLKMSQKLVMTPRLQQALRLLQMPALELQQVLKQELLQNPLLEEVEELTEEPTAEEEAEAESKLEPDDISAAQKEKQEEEKESDDGIDWDEFFHDSYEHGHNFNERPSDDFYEKVPISSESFYESLLSQYRMVTTDEELTRIGEYLIGNLDESGFLALPVEDIARDLEVEPARVEEALKILQGLEPPGIAARDIRECLLLQIRARGMAGSLVESIVSDHLEDLIKRRPLEIARKLKITPADVQAATEIIGTLNPKPGHALAVSDARYITPDVIVERVEDEFVVFLNDRNVPRLRINASYSKFLNNGREPASGERQFIKEKLDSAKWLIRTIEQRRRTIIKVMECIVRTQWEFFERGTKFLKPLTLQQVAEQIGMHESTVSRVTTSKYVQTPHGVFELKHFFSSGLHTDGGEDVSSKNVKMQIEDLVRNEDSHSPMSDQRIVEILNKSGLNIARRTVAKYREQLQILPARMRKKF
ncbi:MAG: RNA polymerase factor sigma-54 [bacterium]